MYMHFIFLFPQLARLPILTLTQKRKASVELWGTRGPNFPCPYLSTSFCWLLPLCPFSVATYYAMFCNFSYFSCFLPPGESHFPSLLSCLGGGTSWRFGWGCVARFWKPLSYYRPKYVIFPTLFQTWPKIWYPISDQTPTLLCLRKHLRRASNSQR